MDRAIYIAMTGAKHNMLSQTAHSNNLANANTTAFKADWEQARSMPVFGEHYPSRAYAQSERPATDFNDGALDATGNPLDVAIAGDGFFAVQSDDGNEAYSRRGDLFVDQLGQVFNGDNNPVLDAGGAQLVLPPYQSIHIGNDGTVSIRPPGAGPNEIQQVGQLKLVNPDYRDMSKTTEGLFRPTADLAGNQPLEADPIVQVRSGFVEQSNVQPVTELVDILALNRQYEMQIKMMKAADTMSQQSAQILRIS